MNHAASVQIRAGSLEGFRDFVFELGHDPAPILRVGGLAPGVLDRPDQLINVSAYRRVLSLAAERTAVPRFGLRLSQRQTFEKLGAVGYLVRHAPNLSVSIDRLIRFFKTHDAGSMSSLEITDGVALWTHDLTGLSDESAIQQTELALGLACRFVRSALGEHWNPEAVHFGHSASGDLWEYQRVFRCPVHFDGSLTAMEFQSSDLSLPLRQSDAGLFAILQGHVEQIDAGRTDDALARVRELVQSGLDQGPVRLDDVAVRMGVSRGSLQAQLRRSGTSFQQILADVRYDLARRYLRETRLAITEISAILGYAEPAVFTRAFARSAGTTPRRWRLDNAP